MKKTLILAAIFLLAACDPPQYNKVGVWYVKNNTDKTVVLSWPSLSDYDWSRMSIAVCDSVEIDALTFSQQAGKYDRQATEPTFGAWLESSVKTRKDETVISSEDGTILKTWRYSDKDMSGRQLYDESLWRIYKNLPAVSWVRDNQGATAWVFDILPEDINS